MREISHRLYRESTEQQIAAHRVNPGQRITAKVGGKEIDVPIAAGTRDAVTCYSEGGRLLVLSVNYGLWYCGLQIFNQDGTLANEVFCQGDEVEQTLGDDGLDLGEREIAKRLAACC